MPQIDPKISVGNIITIGALVVAIALGWQTLASSTENNRKAIQTVQQDHQALSRDVAQDRITNTRILTEMAADLRYLRAGIDEIKSQ